MTDATETTQVIEFIEKRVLTGVLSNLEPREIDGLEIMVGTLTRTVKGTTIAETISVAGSALDDVRDILVEGRRVALYGAIRTDYFQVIGPDLRKRTLARAAEAPRPAAGRSPEAARRRAIYFARRRAAQAA